jgi:isopentenyl phosphate kinase
MPIFPMQTSALISITNNFVTINHAPIKKLVNLDFIPALYGDIIPNETGGQIFSAEKIMELLYEHFSITRIIVCSNAEGVPVDAHDVSCGFVKKINAKNVDDVLDNLSSSHMLDVRDSLNEKLKILYNIAVRAGVNVQIINGTKPEYISECLRGNENIGTLIEGHPKGT